jgi:hypothetical protein
MTRPDPRDYPTWWSYHQAKRAWTKTHGGSAGAVLLLAVIFGALTGSTWVLVMLVVVALLGLAYMRSRP